MIQLWTALSVLSTVAILYQQSQVVTPQYLSTPQYFPLFIKLLSNKFAKIILFNDVILCILWFVKLIQKVFFGSLRESEKEKVWDKFLFTILETCLALTTFREDFSASLFAMFTLLLVVKIFHWISQMRIEYLETQPTTSLTQFIRLYLLLGVLQFSNLFWIQKYYLHHVQRGMSVKFLFLIEYLILFVICFTISIRLILHSVNLSYFSGTWQYRELRVFYLEVFSDVLQSIIYIVFFVTVMTKHRLPIHMMREFYVTVKSLHKRIMDFYNYRKISSTLDQKFADATEEELRQADTICVICREEMQTAKKLPCGHMYHGHCLRSLLEGNQTCPMCQAPIDPDQFHRQRGQQQRAAAAAVPPAHPNAAEVAPQGDRQQQLRNQMELIERTIQQLQQQVMQQHQHPSDTLQQSPSTSVQSSRQGSVSATPTSPIRNSTNLFPINTILSNPPTTATTSLPASVFSIPTLPPQTHNVELNRILLQMYISQLEAMRNNIDATLVQLRQLQQQQQQQQ